MLDLILTGKDIAEVFTSTQKLLQDRKKSILLNQISSPLQEDFKGSTEEFQHELTRLSHETWFQEAINQAVIKASLANSPIAIRMMAIVVAVKVKNNNNFLSFEDMQLLRILQVSPTTK